MTYGHQLQNDVAEFYRALGIPLGETPAFRRTEVRTAMIATEARDAINAADNDDLVEAAAGLCNLIYAIYGAALEWGLDLKPFWDEIHRANMSRAKQEPWQAPDFARILREQLAQAQPGNFTSIIGRSAAAALGG